MCRLYLTRSHILYHTLYLILLYAYVYTHTYIFLNLSCVQTPDGLAYSPGALEVGGAYLDTVGAHPFWL